MSKKNFVRCQLEFTKDEDSFEIDYNVVWIDDKWFGSPYDKNEMKNIIRYLAYVFETDDIDQEQLTKSFKTAVTKTERYINNNLGSGVRRVSLYGYVGSKSRVFVPQHFEYNEEITVHKTGNVDIKNENGKEFFDFTETCLYRGSITMHKDIIITNDVKLKNPSLDTDPDHHYNNVVFPNMHNRKWDVYALQDKDKPEIPWSVICLIDSNSDLYGMKWTETQVFIEPGAKKLCFCNKKHSKNLLNQLEESSGLSLDNGLVISETFGHSDEPYSTWLSVYVSYLRTYDGERIVQGIAIDTAARQSGESSVLFK